MSARGSARRCTRGYVFPEDWTFCADGIAPGNHTRRHKYEKELPSLDKSWIRRGSTGGSQRGVVGTRAGRTTPAMAFGHSFPSSTEEGSICRCFNVVNLCRHV